ncbi:hypothetical protein OIU35_32820 [Boseaceae bacterium BT-24-1]|nr:hypothetical protein [Boseaceae bacterium BT-24-1]
MAVTSGFYAALITGADSEGLVMFVAHDGKITGVDPSKVLFDGTYHIDENGGLVGKVMVKAPPNGTLVQGVSTGPHGISYETSFTIPDDFEEREFVRITTPLGPVNAKFLKLREL